MKRLISFVAMGIAVNYALGGVSGCSSAAPDPEKATHPVAKKGTLTMALQAVSDSGKVYRLRNAEFLVEPGFFFGGTVGGGTVVGTAFPDGGAGGPGGFLGGSAGGPGGFLGGSPQFPDGGVGAAGFFGAGGSVGVGGKGSGAGGFFETGGSATAGFGGFGAVTGGTNTFFLSSEDDPNAAVIQRFLAPGGYDIDLFGGWFVEQVDDLLGTASQVDATLDSSSFQFFNITSDQETFVRFDFTVDGSRVTFGPPGRLIVGIHVNERNGQQVCGDGIVENGESCDGPDLQGATCASITMGSQPFGTLFCSQNCFFDTTFCTGGFNDGGTGGFGGGSGGSPAQDSGTAGSVGFPTVDAGMAGAGGVSGKTPIP